MAFPDPTVPLPYQRAIPTASYTTLDIGTPALVYSLDTTANGVEFLANPGKDPTTDDLSYQSRAGVIYLPFPGLWRIKAKPLPNVTISAGQIVATVEPCSDVADANSRRRTIFEHVPSATVAVATTSTTILAAFARRQYLFIMNTGTDDLWVDMGQAAVVGVGYGLIGKGAYLEFDAGRRDMVPKSSITGIMATSATNISVIEG